MAPVPVHYIASIYPTTEYTYLYSNEMWTYLYSVVSAVATDNFPPIIINTKGYSGLKIIYTLLLIGHRRT